MGYNRQKKMTRIFKLAALAAIAIIAVIGCKTTQSVQSSSSTEVTVPLSEKEYRSDKDYFRATQSGKSPDLATAKKIALQNAKTELAGNIQTLIKAVTENYTNQRTVGDKQEFENKFEEYARAVVNQTLNDVKIIGEKVFKESDGKHTYYIAIEMNKEAMFEKVSDRISKDAKLQLDFDKYQFQKIFDEEMKKFEDR
jgi:basic membrane lipoprotein Med (substrate-binding protein (PBP1-ABC) superfamily)